MSLSVSSLSIYIWSEIFGLPSEAKHGGRWSYVSLRASMTAMFAFPFSPVGDPKISLHIWSSLLFIRSSVVVGGGGGGGSLTLAQASTRFGFCVLDMDKV